MIRSSCFGGDGKIPENIKLMLAWLQGLVEDAGTETK
jgi:hypothetical protein